MDCSSSFLIFNQKSGFPASLAMTILTNSRLGLNIIELYRFKNKFGILTIDKKAVFDSRSVIFGNDEFLKI